MIELYGMGSPNVRKVAIMLEEVGAAYTFRHVDVFRAAQFDPAFEKLNPNRKVPVLVDHEAVADEPVTIFESGAILIYLAEKHGRFLPATEPERSSVLQWLMVQTCNIGPMLGQLNHFQFVARDGNAYARSRYYRESERLYTLLEGRLASVPYLAGQEYSIADIATYPWALYLEKHGFRVEDYPALSAWRERIAARPAVGIAMDMIERATAGDAAALATASPKDLDRFFGRV